MNTFFNYVTYKRDSAWARIYIILICIMFFKKVRIFFKIISDKWIYNDQMLFSQISLTRHFIVMISQDYLELLNCLVRLMMRDSLHVFICVMGVLDFLPSPQAIYKRTQRHTPLVLNATPTTLFLMFYWSKKAWANNKIIW